jgi:hypothetical protein
MLAGGPHEAAGNGSPRWMAAGPLARVHRTRPTGRLVRRPTGANGRCCGAPWCPTAAGDPLDLRYALRLERSSPIWKAMAAARARNSSRVSDCRRALDINSFSQPSRVVLVLPDRYAERGHDAEQRGAVVSNLRGEAFKHLVAI